jgi:hypothetical protein
MPTDNAASSFSSKMADRPKIGKLGKIIMPSVTEDKKLLQDTENNDNY